MQINPVTTTTSAATNPAATAATTATITPKKALGQDDFLKLLSVQFQNQDPLKPQDDTGFIAQMAQFTSLDQTTTMSKDIATLLANQQLTTANSYLGHRVTVDDGTGATRTGEVSGVEVTGGVPRLVIGDFTFPVSSVLLVEPGTVTTPVPANTGGN